jgi:hypothetical protein
VDAREQLCRAYEMLTALGIEAFAERPRRECCTWQRRPAMALGLKHHSRRAVAVQNGRDDAPFR